MILCIEECIVTVEKPHPVLSQTAKAWVIQDDRRPHGRTPARSGVDCSASYGSYM